MNKISKFTLWIIGLLSLFLFYIVNCITDIGTVSTPTFSPEPGIFTTDQTVSISSSTVDATIYYTTDGAEPTTSSTIYSTPISVAGDGTTMTVKAFAVKAGMYDSIVTSGDYTISYTVTPLQVETPTFNPPAGTYSSDQSVTISSLTTGAILYYTTDGTNPTITSSVYTTPVSVAGNGTSMTIKAFAVKSGMTDSAIATGIFTINYSYTAKDITAFSFNSGVTGLSKTYTGTILGTNISVNLPYGIVSSAVASFTTTGASVKVGTTTQTSGVTINNFTSSISYVVTATDSSTKTYIVTVTPLAQLSDTAQTTCYDNTTALGACANATYPRQDADYLDIPNARTFSGPTTNSGYASDYITKETLNGLTFKTCSEGLSGINCATGTISAMDWASAGTACTNLNSLNSGAGYAGKTNWRLPTVNELANLVNYQVAAPTVDIAYFPATGSNFYWAGTNLAGTPANAWSVSSNNGVIANIIKTTNTYNVRCVSGDIPPAQNYTNNGDGTITDRGTNLRWQQCSAGYSDATCSTAAPPTTFLWNTALTYCNNLTLASRSWRLPSANELRSLVDYSVDTSGGAVPINTNFPGTLGAFYWTGTTVVASPTTAWNVHFVQGNLGVIATVKGSDALKVRCVTNGP